MLLPAKKSSPNLSCGHGDSHNQAQKRLHTSGNRSRTPELTDPTCTQTLLKHPPLSAAPQRCSLLCSHTLLQPRACSSQGIKAGKQSQPRD